MNMTQKKNTHTFQNYNQIYVLLVNEMANHNIQIFFCKILFIFFKFCRAMRYELLLQILYTSYLPSSKTSVDHLFSKSQSNTTK